MEIFQLMVFVIPVFSALSPVFSLAGQRDFVYENNIGAKTKIRWGEKRERNHK